MPEVQDIKVLNIDDVQYNVESMSETSQRLVGVFNDWNRKEAAARDDLTILQAAKETLSRQIIDQVRKEKAEAEAEAAAESVTTTEAPSDETPPGDE